MIIVKLIVSAFGVLFLLGVLTFLYNLPQGIKRIADEMKRYNDRKEKERNGM